MLVKVRLSLPHLSAIISPFENLIYSSAKGQKTGKAGDNLGQAGDGARARVPRFEYQKCLHAPQWPFSLFNGLARLA